MAQDKPDYQLTPQQKRFVKKAESEGYKVNYDYSGRGMYGRKCPSIIIKRFEEDFIFRNSSSDSMGLDKVIYMA